MEKPQQHVAPTAAIASGFITDAGPQFWKSDTALKTTLFEGVKLIFGPQFFSSASAIYVACAFSKKNDQNWPNMTVVCSCLKKTLAHIGGHHPVPYTQSQLVPTKRVQQCTRSSGSQGVRGDQIFRAGGFNHKR